MVISFVNFGLFIVQENFMRKREGILAAWRGFLKKNMRTPKIHAENPFRGVPGGRLRSKEKKPEAIRIISQRPERKSSSSKKVDLK
jgi:hypothetical protein